MKNIETLKNYIVDQNKSDSGDPLVTSLIIIGVMVVVALAIYLAFGNALADRGDDVVTDVKQSGTQFSNDGRDHIEFGNEANATP